MDRKDKYWLILLIIGVSIVGTAEILRIDYNADRERIDRIRNVNETDEQVIDRVINQKVDFNDRSNLFKKVNKYLLHGGDPITLTAYITANTPTTTTTTRPPRPTFPQPTTTTQRTTTTRGIIDIGL